MLSHGLLMGFNALFFKELQMLCVKVAEIEYVACLLQ